MSTFTDFLGFSLATFLLFKLLPVFILTLLDAGTLFLTGEVSLLSSGDGVKPIQLSRYMVTFFFKILPNLDVLLLFSVVPFLGTAKLSSICCTSASGSFLLVLTTISRRPLTKS